MQSFNDLYSWENEQEVTQCRACHTFFDMFTWKHHCRSCGRVFCDWCTCYYTYIPAQDLCPDTPSEYTLTNPSRCCAECSTAIVSRVDSARERNRLGAAVSTQDHISRSERPPRTLNAVEFNPSLPSRLFIVQLPLIMEVRTGQTLRVQLDNFPSSTGSHIILPPNISPGDVIYVRANENTDYIQGNAGRHQQIVITSVMVVDISYNDVLNQGTTGNINDVPTEEYLECKQCTYRNFINAEKCAVCDSPIL